MHRTGKLVQKIQTFENYDQVDLTSDKIWKNWISNKISTINETDVGDGIHLPKMYYRSITSFEFRKVQ